MVDNFDLVTLNKIIQAVEALKETGCIDHLKAVTAIQNAPYYQATDMLQKAALSGAWHQGADSVLSYLLAIKNNNTNKPSARPAMTFEG